MKCYGKQKTLVYWEHKSRFTVGPKALEITSDLLKESSGDLQLEDLLAKVTFGLILTRLNSLLAGSTDQKLD
ncbi:MAG: hypothetical protein Ct9H300mP19_09740 [Dehalococcoidia bacterium]|nr:MAG: hypothetical protein Ct9H300mP19_09740 [Dehalococcoidia bacterium]